MTIKEKAQIWARTVNLKHVALAAWILDVLSCLYMVRWWETKNLSQRIMSMSMQINNISPEDVAPEFQTEFLGLAAMVFAGLILALVITNTIFYTGYAYKKRWAVTYVTGYLVTAGIVGLTFLFEGFPVGGAWELVNIVGIPLYFVLGFIAWTIKRDLNPVVESPAR